MTMLCALLAAASVAIGAGEDGGPAGDPPPVRAAVIEFVLERDHEVGPGEREAVGGLPTAAALRELVPALAEDRISVVVLQVRIHDMAPVAPGDLEEARALARVLWDEFDPRFRVVAWIESAVGTAALPLLAVDEHYYRPEGNFGALMPHGEGLSWLPVLVLGEWIRLASDICHRMVRPPEVARAMVSPMPLSADGLGAETRFRQDSRGEHVLKHAGDILTLNSSTATRFGLARGIASTRDELAAAMGLAAVEWIEMPGDRLAPAADPQERQR